MGKNNAIETMGTLGLNHDTYEGMMLSTQETSNLLFFVEFCWFLPIWLIYRTSLFGGTFLQ